MAQSEVAADITESKHIIEYYHPHNKGGDWVVDCGMRDTARASLYLLKQNIALLFCGKSSMKGYLPLAQRNYKVALMFGLPPPTTANFPQPLNYQLQLKKLCE